MTLTAGLWLCAGLIAGALTAGVLTGIAADATLTLRDLRRTGQKYLR